MRVIPVDLSTFHDWFDLQVGPGCGLVFHYAPSIFKINISLLPTALFPNFNYCQVKFDSDPSVSYISANPTKIIRTFKKVWFKNVIVSEAFTAGAYLYIYVLESEKDFYSVPKIHSSFQASLAGPVQVNIGATEVLYFENFEPIIDRVFLAATVDNVNNRIDLCYGNVVLLSFTGALQYNQNVITIGEINNIKLVNTGAPGIINFTDIYLFLRGVA